jgi:hypothetical protein
VSPASDLEAACSGCFLYERRGVCPMVLDTYGLQNSAEAQRRAEALHAAVREDAKVAVSLSELVRHGASRPSLAGLLLPSRPAEPIPTDSRKEATHVSAPRTIP